MLSDSRIASMGLEPCDLPPSSTDSKDPEMCNTEETIGMGDMQDAVELFSLSGSGTATGTVVAVDLDGRQQGNFIIVCKMNIGMKLLE